MRIPEFTAEASFYKSTRAYGHAGFCSQVSENSEIIPQFHGLRCWLSCMISINDPFDCFLLCMGRA